MRYFLIVSFLVTLTSLAFINYSEYNYGIDQTITITAKYPDLILVQKNYLSIRGDSCGLNWSTGVKMTKIDYNTWQIQLQCPIGQLLQFKTLINEQTWESGSNRLVLATYAKSVMHYPFFQMSSGGTLDIMKKIASPTLGNTRDVITYLPPSYNENTQKFYSQILIMHDGQNLFDRNTAFMGQAWMCQDTVAPLIYQGAIEEVLIVGIYNTAGRMEEYTYSFDPEEGFGGNGDAYLDFIEQEIFPRLRSKYRIANDAKFGILGSSLGGLVSCYAGFTRSNIYDKIGCMSSSFWWNNEDFLNIIMKQTKQKPLSSKFYIDSGDSGPSLDDRDQTIRVRDQMVSQFGYKLNNDLYYYLDKGASHSEYYWGKRFSQPMIALYAPSPI